MTTPTGAGRGRDTRHGLGATEPGRPWWLRPPTGDTPRATLARARLATSGAFFFQGLIFAVILTNLPAFKERFGIGDGEVTGLILGITLMAGVGSVSAGRFAGRAGSAPTLRLAVTVAALAVLVAGVAADVGVLWLFVVALACYGLGLGGIDAAGNMVAVAVEHRYGRSILTSFHAVWSAAGILGALGTWAAARLGVSAGITLVIATGVCLYICEPGVRSLSRRGPTGLPPVTSESREQEPVTPVAREHVPVTPVAREHVPVTPEHEQERVVAGREHAVPVPARPPWRPVLLLAAALACVYVADSGISSWSAIFLHDTLLASNATAALGYAAYQGTALLSRAGGDLLVRRRGASVVVGGGAVLAIVGMLAVVSAQSVGVAIVGFALVGLGAGVVAPLTFAAVGALAPGAADGTIAVVNLFNYVGAIGGGVLVGGIGAVGSLRGGFVVALVAVVLLLALAPAFTATARHGEREAVAGR